MKPKVTVAAAEALEAAAVVLGVSKASIVAGLVEAYAATVPTGYVRRYRELRSLNGAKARGRPS